MTQREDPAIAARAQGWMDSVGVRLLRPLSPIYSDGINKPDLVGSGVLVRLADQVFLVSAAHVADMRPRYFGSSEELLPIPKLSRVSPLPATGLRDDDPIDLAYWFLDPATQARLTSVDAVRVEQLDGVPVADIPCDNTYYMNGYPVTRQPRWFDGDVLHAGTIAFVTSERPLSEYAEIDRRRDDTLFIGYDKGNFFRYGSKRLGPDLFGVSGGAVWRVDGPACSPTNPRLTAFVTRWRVKQPWGVRATRLHVWLRALSREFPDITGAAAVELRCTHRTRELL